MNSTLIETLTRRPELDDYPRFTVYSMLAEGVFALNRGDEKRALLLFAAATLATKHRALAYPLWGLATVRRLAEYGEEHARNT